ncbi:transglutaminase-like domain-containing protein [Propionicicella superfundia]|uniref:transglutaminase-like domain-containing protein n=1 Tax=Propionicicella superfundia TaxID=348582 RepID=UPI00040318FD|nr:transglutaminase family protein [Propionicicella superfundia]
MVTRTLRIGGEFVHVAQAATPAIFILQPPTARYLSGETWYTAPGIDLHEYRDLFGNRCHRTVLPAGESVVAYYAVADVPDDLDEADLSAPQLPPESIPEDLLVYTMPSRYAQSDVLSQEAWALFGHLPATYERPRAISEFVHAHLTYSTGSTGSWWTAVDAFNNRYGVCRDFAHLMVALCRALNLPARYVTGMLPDLDVVPNPAPMDYHAWCEVYLGDRWWTFDPRHDARRKGRVPVAYGRDAVDVALCSTFGSPWLKRMTVFCEELAGDLAGTPWPPVRRPAG